MNVVRVGDRFVVAQVNRCTCVEVLLTIIDDRLSEVVPSEDDFVVEPVVSLALLFKLDSLLELPAVRDFHVVVNCHRVIQDHVVVTDLDGVRVAIVCNDDCSEWVEHGLVDLSLVILVSDPPVSVVELPLDLGKDFVVLPDADVGRLFLHVVVAAVPSAAVVNKDLCREVTRCEPFFCTSKVRF